MGLRDDLLSPRSLGLVAAVLLGAVPLLCVGYEGEPARPEIAFGELMKRVEAGSVSEAVLFGRETLDGPDLAMQMAG